MANNTAYGFHNLQEIFAQRIGSGTQNVELVRSAITATVAEHTRQLNEVTSVLASRTTAAKARFTLPTSGTLQPIDEFGNPRPVVGGSYYEVGFPIQGGGTAFGTDRVSRQLMTIQQANDDVLGAQLKDADWMMRHMLAALFSNTAWTYTDRDSTIGDISVKGLASGDTDKYAFAGGTVNTDNHYRATADAIDDSHNPFSPLRKELSEHPGNRGPFVAYVPSNLVDAITALTEFKDKPDENITTLTGEVLNNEGAQVRRFGDEVLGYLKSARMWVVEWKRLPDSYMVAASLGNTEPVLRMREYDAPGLQGFFPELHSPDGNLNITRLLRYAGFGVYDRTGAAVQLIGNGTYSVPTGYTAPLAI